MKQDSKTSVTQRIKEPAPNNQNFLSQTRIMSDPEIEKLVAEIVVRSKEPNDRLIEVARKLAQLRTLFNERYRDLGRTWYEWARQALTGIKDKKLLGLLNEIAESHIRGEPLAKQRAILERHHKQGARRSREFRQRTRARKKHTEAHFDTLIKWSETAKPNQLEHVKAGIAQLIAEAMRLSS